MDTIILIVKVVFIANLIVFEWNLTMDILLQLVLGGHDDDDE